jgi:hypothetical protein
VKHIVEYLPKMWDVRRHLDSGQSVLLYAPRYHGKRRFLSSIRSAYMNGSTTCIQVSSNSVVGPIDYQLLWNDTARQIGVGNVSRISDSDDYKQEFRASLEVMLRRVVILVTGSERGNEKNLALVRLPPPSARPPGSDDRARRG